MPLCPGCRTEQTRRTDGRYCPECWIPVDIFTTKDGEKIWYRANEDAPPTHLMHYWEGVMSERLSAEQGLRVTYQIHSMRQRNKYQREVALAENLLMQVDFDMLIAKEALRRATMERWIPPESIAQVYDAFITQAMIVQAEEEQEKDKKSADYTQDRLDGMEDVWS